MRVMRLHEYGSSAVLHLDEAPEPVPAPGELLLRTEAIGVTLPAVRQLRGEGEQAPLPRGLGGEVAGTVLAVGAQVTGYQVGDRVTAVAFADAYADLVTVPTATASHIPGHADSVQAVALVRSGQVALATLTTANPRPDESVLVTGAASGVGHLALQLAKIRGVGRVVAAVGSAAKKNFVRDLGADEAVGYADADWGTPVDIVLDGVGGPVLPAALAALNPGGRLIYFNSGGGTVPAHALLAGSTTITGMTIRRFATTQPELYQRHDQLLWQLHATGRLRPSIHAELPLTDAAAALRIIETRTNKGKVVVRP
ncbi:zinc-binding dehydrogenase [Paractinoplanes ferrugineus]|uniref:Oxidoreductase n=1 Tax=Paractinoplanes ferrugineus TaxID=113564 RepID=A0A919JAQ1_9ACTN|nr:zinc-binding dehydrogenase [Actinoplanes ferrugineus]GIE16183.1 oxidoreductase [Actinoplanes ferrugineus]